MGGGWGRWWWVREGGGYVHGVGGAVVGWFLWDVCGRVRC